MRLDFEAYHTIEGVGLSVSTVAMKTTSTQRALCVTVDGSTAHRGVAKLIPFLVAW